RMHLAPDASFNGHFNVLRGYIAPMTLAGVKIVGDFVDNWQQGLPSEMGLLNLFDPRTGRPVAIIDAAGLTDMRTGAVTPIEPMLKPAWLKRGSLVVPYGTMSAVELSLTDIMDKIIVDDWGQCRAGQFGSLRAHVNAGKLTEATLHAELGKIVAGGKPGREHDSETILLWHRGLPTSDIALG